MTARLLALPMAVQAAPASFDVREFGAKGDGIAKDTAAIQAAVDAASRSGGTVTLPPGRYLSGTIHLKSSVAIHLAAGATLAMSPDNADFDAHESLPYPNLARAIARASRISPRKGSRDAALREPLKGIQHPPRFR